VAEDRNHVTHRGQKVGRQIMLPTSRAFEIAWKGMKIRLWRSLITMSGIILAIAFLTSIWTSGVFNRALRDVPPSDELYALVQDALEAEAIAGSEARVLCAVVGEQSGPIDIEHISPALSIEHFVDGQKAFRSVALPPDPLAIHSLLGAEDGSRPDAVVLAGLPRVLSDDEVVADLKSFVESGGVLCIYGSQGLEALSGSAFEQLLPAAPKGGTFKADGSGMKPGTRAVQVLWQNHPPAEFLVTEGKPGAEPLATAGEHAVGWVQQVGKGVVAWYSVSSADADAPDVLTWFLRGRTKGSAGGGADDRTGGLALRMVSYGAGQRGKTRDMRGIWLVTLSLMVCVVGITNAMLMSVTERFREIGTMKCLGALDRFVVKLFLIESSLQGVVGSLAGAIIGFLLSFVRVLFQFHVQDVQTGEKYWLALRYFPALSLLGWMGVAVATGAMLSVVAAIYPAMRAAKMEPVQAMRVEA